MSYEFEVRRRDQVTARGAMVAVLVDSESGEALAWPDETRAFLLAD
ncbi:MAG: hypothetical protein ACR2KG_01465 [Nocardioidaceae bacterium]